jgi:uncharacterized protein (TIGR02996 family)
MSEAGFLSAIRNDPNDPATRLIYSDYLEERGDPRGELLRLDARLAEPGLESAEFDELRERLKQFRAGLDPLHKKWLAAVDAPDRFTILLTNEYCDRLRTYGQIGKPLRFIPTLRLVQFRPRPGMIVYPIRIHQKNLYLVGRMRLATVATRDAHLTAYPDDGPLVWRWEDTVLVGEEGTPIQSNTVVPHNMLHRFHYLSGTRSHPLKHVKHGRLTHPIGLTGVTRITKATAQDLDFLLTGKVARPVSVPGP